MAQTPDKMNRKISILSHRTAIVRSNPHLLFLNNFSASVEIGHAWRHGTPASRTRGLADAGDSIVTGQENHPVSRREDGGARDAL